MTPTKAILVCPLQVLISQRTGTGTTMIMTRPHDAQLPSSKARKTSSTTGQNLLPPILYLTYIIQLPHRGARCSLGHCCLLQRTGMMTSRTRTLLAPPPLNTPFPLPHLTLALRPGHMVVVHGWGWCKHRDQKAGTMSSSPVPLRPTVMYVHVVVRRPSDPANRALIPPLRKKTTTLTKTATSTSISTQTRMKKTKRSPRAHAASHSPSLPPPTRHLHPSQPSLSPFSSPPPPHPTSTPTLHSPFRAPLPPPSSPSLSAPPLPRTRARPPLRSP